ncbi:MAG TPA: nucleotidyltransferase domain-containing protein, partial [Gaiellaceae bacterium]|nr:nucleotidyltransferase domain-containing protein [Gaiellaceae bacterium]
MRAATKLAQEIADSCAELLGDRLVAVILHGSLVLGDYSPASSDVDLLAIVERPLTDDELAALAELVLARHGEAAGIDLRAVTRAVAGEPTESPAMELYVGVHHDHEPELLRRIVGERDLVAELSMVRAVRRSLVGPDPTAVVAAMPAERVVAYGDEVLERWQQLTDDAEHAALMVLTGCRIWRFAVGGVHCSKTEAARWALLQEPALPAVEAALRR